MKSICLKTIIILLLVSVIIISGCKKTDDDRAAMVLLRQQMPVLVIFDAEGNNKTITLDEANLWHEEREHGHTDFQVSADKENHSARDYPLCLGVTIGYQAIRFAVDKLFGQNTPEISDFSIAAGSASDGVWDMLSFYAGKELEFTDEPGPLSRENFTFTATRISENKTCHFRLRPELISEEFFKLKNQGATCGHHQAAKLKKQALINILSVAPRDCFEIIDAETAKPQNQEK